VAGSSAFGPQPDTRLDFVISGYRTFTPTQRLHIASTLTAETGLEARLLAPCIRSAIFPRLYVPQALWRLTCATSSQVR